MAWVIGKIIDKTIGFRIEEEEEVAGIDIAVHAESAYDLAPSHGGGALAAASAAAASPAKVEAEA